MMNEFNPDGKDIRFIDSHYRDLFRIPDGGTIQVHYSDDSVVIKPCKFIDEYHTVDEIQDILGISRTSAYNLVKRKVFHSVRIGGSIRISKKSFDEWLDHQM